VEDSIVDGDVVILPIGSSVIYDYRPFIAQRVRDCQEGNLGKGELLKTLTRPAVVEIENRNGVQELSLKPIETQPTDILLTLAHFPANDFGHNALVRYDQALWLRWYEYRHGAEDMIAITSPENLVIIHDPAVRGKPWVVLDERCSRVSWSNLGKNQKLAS
jgi:hypothetical protein